ncbi:MAG: hypothetical protein AXA67_09635 [Methylothermaceae bacteria B42]|nr:MAG: hypothetical protein AXA67_09635 [Methylothermaceae bacteria B42]
MSTYEQIKNIWENQNEWVKILIALALGFILAWILTGRDKSRLTPLASLGKNGEVILVNNKGKPIPLKNCTVEPGENQCSIFNDTKHKLLQIRRPTIILSESKGSTICCLIDFEPDAPRELCGQLPSRYPTCYAWYYALFHGG